MGAGRDSILNGSGKMEQQCQQHDVEFRWVRGHSGNPDNERCDELALPTAQRADLAVDLAYEAASLERNRRML
jgi:ribonuclease HI